MSRPAPRLPQSPQRENWRPIAQPIIQIMSMQVRCTPDTGRSLESYICNCRIAAAENVSSIGTLTSNNTPYERQTARLNRETARQAEIKSNPAPVIWLYAHRSGLANLIPGLFPQKAKCHSGEVAGRGVGKWMWSGLLVVVVVGLNNYESGSLTFWGVNLKSTGDRGVGLFISLGCP